MQEVEGDAFRERDPGLGDASVRAKHDRTGRGDLGLVAVADQPGEPVVGEAGGRGLHEEQVFGRGGIGGGGQGGRRIPIRLGDDRRQPRVGEAGGAQRVGAGGQRMLRRGEHDSSKWGGAGRPRIWRPPRVPCGSSTASTSAML